MKAKLDQGHHFWFGLWRKVRTSQTSGLYQPLTMQSGWMTTSRLLSVSKIRLKKSDWGYCQDKDARTNWNPWSCFVPCFVPCTCFMLSLPHFLSFLSMCTPVWLIYPAKSVLSNSFPIFFKYCEKRPFPPQSSLIAVCFYEHFPFRVFLFLLFVMLIVFDDKIIKLGPMEETWYIFFVIICPH